MVDLGLPQILTKMKARHHPHLRQTTTVMTRIQEKKSVKNPEHRHGEAQINQHDIIIKTVKNHQKRRRAHTPKTAEKLQQPQHHPRGVK